MKINVTSMYISTLTYGSVWSIDKGTHTITRTGSSSTRQMPEYPGGLAGVIDVLIISLSYCSASEDDTTNGEKKEYQQLCVNSFTRSSLYWSRYSEIYFIVKDRNQGCMRIGKGFVYDKFMFWLRYIFILAYSWLWGGGGGATRHLMCMVEYFNVAFA